MISFLHLLKKAKQTKLINNQQYKTLKGQYHSGDIAGAKKGFSKLVKKALYITEESAADKNEAVSN